VTGALLAELGLGPGARVLDLAAGTGKLTRALVRAGADVVAVEPQQALRDVLARVVPAATVLDGVAEKLPVADGSLDAVTIADAFHWFDQPRALREIARALRPEGGLALVTVVPDWREASWGDELGQLIHRSRPSHPQFDGTPWQEAVRAAGGWLEPWEVSVIARGPADPERVIDYVGSFSWVAAMDDEEQRAMLQRVRVLLEGGETPAQLPVRFFVTLTRRT
jgi:SAM-dependent methyltransferase